MPGCRVTWHIMAAGPLALMRCLGEGGERTFAAANLRVHKRTIVLWRSAASLYWRGSCSRTSSLGAYHAFELHEALTLAWILCAGQFALDVTQRAGCWGGSVSCLVTLTDSRLTTDSGDRVYCGWLCDA